VKSNARRAGQEGRCRSHKGHAFRQGRQNALPLPAAVSTEGWPAAKAKRLAKAVKAAKLVGMIIGGLQA
jgi:hypothetical protein